MLYRDVRLQHWDRQEQDAASAQAHAAREQAEEQDADETQNMVVMPADPAAPPTALNATVGPQAHHHRHRQQRQQERLYFQLSRASGQPLSIDVDQALEVSA